MTSSDPEEKCQGSEIYLQPVEKKLIITKFCQKSLRNSPPGKMVTTVAKLLKQKRAKIGKFGSWASN